MQIKPMIFKKLKTLTLISSVVLFCSPVLSAETFQSIEVQGNNRIDRAAVIEKMSLRPGQAVTSEAVRRDIQNIFELGFFKEVQMSLEGRKLVVSVVERPYVARIDYQGSSEFEDKDLVEASKLRPFRVLSYTEIQAAVLAIQKKYEDKGYYLAQVRFEVVPTRKDGSEVQLIFTIVENEQVKIRKIHLLGNKKITTGELKQAMYTSEGHMFSWATGGGTFRDDFFERDVSALAMFYGNEGYIEAKITKPRVTLSQDRRYIDVLVDIQEGKKFYLEDVVFKGDIIFSEEKLREALGMKPGDVFSTGVLQEGLLKLGDLYGDEGYAFANVIPRPEVKSEEQKVALVVDIQKGEKIYWGEIKVTGNTKTHDKVIRRELKFVEGELTHATRRKKSLSNLQRLGFFDEDIKFLTTTRKDQSTVMDLEIRVKEKPTGTLNLQAGYGNDAGFSFQAGVTQSNLFGRGQDVSLQASWASSNAMNLDVGFTDPKIFDSDWLFGTNFYWSRRRVGPQTDQDYTYFQDSKGVGFRLGQEIAEHWLLAGRYRFSNTQLRDPINPEIFSRPEDQDTLISSVGMDLTYDTRNNRLDPSKGVYLYGGIEAAGLGGRVFQQVEASARFYQRVVWKLVYRTRLEVGYIANFMDQGNVPDSERYILGGVSSLRGYDGGSIGTVKRLGGTRNGSNPAIEPYVIGGTHKIVWNQELEFPLIPEANIRAVAFFDVGNAWAGDLAGKSPALLSNYGWGIRWYSPMGPLRFEWGFPLADTDFNSKGESVFQFMIAPTF